MRIRTRVAAPMALAALLLVASEARACHRCHQRVCVTPAACVYAVPMPVSVVVAAPAPRVCGVCGRRFRLFGHKHCRRPVVVASPPVVLPPPVVVPPPVVLPPPLPLAPTTQVNIYNR